MPLPAHLCLIYGSNRDNRLCDTVANWLQCELEDTHFTSDIIDPGMHHDLRERNEKLARADGFIVITPEYNHSFPAPLKAIIDGAKSEWEAKPVAFVSYGASISGGMQAVEQLRGVFAALHTVSVREQVAIARAHTAFGADGTPHDRDGLHQAFTRMMKRLTWWSDALSRARAKHPYSEAA